MNSALIIVFLMTWQRKNPVYADAEKPNMTLYYFLLVLVFQQKIINSWEINTVKKTVLKDDIY